jgi:DNA-binding transcriptional ArsR family regulator
VLLALALEGHVLGNARHHAGERLSSRPYEGLSSRPYEGLSSRPYEGHFQRLRRLGVVLAAGRGRLFCCLDRDTIAQRTGLDRRTVTRATNALAERHLLEKRRVRNRKGRHDCVYFVRSLSCLAKFDAGPPSAPLQGRGHALLVVEVNTPCAVEWLEKRQKRVIQRAVEARLRQGAEIRFQARDSTLPEE